MAVYQDGKLVLYGFVGDNYWGEGFTSLDVLEALAEHGRENDIDVHINSGGGYAFEGLAIYNALNSHEGVVRIVVDAIAASAASTIAMAGDKITMKAGSMMMIHDPSGVTFGTADDHEKSLSMLDKLGDQMASLYASRSNNEIDDVRQDMKDELWMTSSEAVEQGYADTAESAKAKAVAAFDYRAYSKAPDKLVARARAKNWSLERAVQKAAASAASPNPSEEKPMGTKNGAGAQTAPQDASASAGDPAADVKARIRAIMSCEEAKGRETLANHFAFETEMSVEDAVAALNVTPVATAAPESSGKSDNGNSTADAGSYEKTRMQSSGQAAPTGGQQTSKSKTTMSRGEIFAARAKQMNGG